MYLSWNKRPLSVFQNGLYIAGACGMFYAGRRLYNEIQDLHEQIKGLTKKIDSNTDKTKHVSLNLLNPQWVSDLSQTNHHENVKSSESTPRDFMSSSFKIDLVQRVDQMDRLLRNLRINDRQREEEIQELRKQIQQT